MLFCTLLSDFSQNPCEKMTQETTVQYHHDNTHVKQKALWQSDIFRQRGAEGIGRA